MPDPTTAQHRRAVSWVVAAALVPTALLAWVTRSTVTSATSPDADVSAVLAGAALVLAWVVVARLALTAGAVLLARAPGAVGAAAARVAVSVSPRMMRGLVRVAAGTVVAVAPATTVTAAMADPGPAVRAVASTSVRVLPTESLPVLDRVLTPAEPAPAPPTRPAAAASVRTVVVRSGDTLWDIADRALPAGHTDADVARAWPRWFAANRATIGPDAGLIRPGEHLRAPADGDAA